MPHAVAPPSWPAAAPPPSQPLDPLLAHAHAAASRSFRAHAAAVLRAASIKCLRRTLSERVRAHLQSLPSEQLAGKASTEELLGWQPEVLRVSEEDVRRCDGLAERVGKKWAEVLRRRGYHEFADIAVDVAKRGRFMERPSSEDAVTADDGNDEEPKAGEFASAYTALHALRRYPPDCDGSGLPSQHLPQTDCVDGEISSARKVIRQIDRMAQNGETDWHHGWDAVEEAVARNRTRMEYARVRSGIGVRGSGANNEQECAGLGAVASAEGTATLRASKKRGRVVQFKGDPGEDPREGSDLDGGSTAGILKRRRIDQEAVYKLEEDAGEVDAEKRRACAVVQRGRPASSVGEVALDYDEARRSMSMEERRGIIMSAIHPPYPFESVTSEDMPDEEDAEEKETHAEDAKHGAVVCGALKKFGQTHLWEQTRHLPETDSGDDASDVAEGVDPTAPEGVIYGATEAQASFRAQKLAKKRKSALTRATRERLGRRAISIGEHKAEYSKVATHSKVKWTEDAAVAVEEEGLVGAASTNSALMRQCELGEGRPRKWLEMDLGECTIELADDEMQSGSGQETEGKEGEGNRRFFSFRSLELALND